MFVPLYDGVRLRFIAAPYGTWLLVGLNALVYFAMAAGLFGNTERIDEALGVTPAVLLGNATLARSITLVPPPVTILTGMFIHASPMHLIGNMLFLRVFGDNVEDAMGSLRFVLFYLLSGLTGALLYAFMLPQSDGPLIGASGAVSGVVIAYLMLYPRVRVFGLVLSFLPLRIPAIFCVGAWVLLQIVSAFSGGDAEVGWWAHVGGLAAGAALTPVFKRPEVPLFSRQTG